MSMTTPSKTELLEQIHKPQNALMHQKSHRTMLDNIPPILTEIIEDGIKEKIFKTPYPSVIKLFRLDEDGAQDEVRKPALLQIC